MLIKLNPKNPRQITPDKFEKLKKSIEEFPQMLELRPIIVDENGIILGGNMRFRAIQALGWEMKDSWYKVADKLTPEEARRFIVEDNLPFGEWDFDALSSEYDVEELLAWGFDAKDLHIDKELTQDEPPPLEEGEAESKYGEVYQLGEHRLICGDATKIEDVDKLMSGSKANMVFTDPPYNVGYEGGAGGKKRKGILNDSMTTDKFEEFLYLAISNMATVTKGAFYICMSPLELHTLRKAFDRCKLHWASYVIWTKDHFTLSGSDYQHQFEPILYGLDKSAVEMLEGEDYESSPILYGYSSHEWYGGRKQSDIWKFVKPVKSVDHPTMKPIALCGKAIQNSSLIGNNVLDLFGGSGSTLIACEQLQRKCFMSELDPHYCDVIRKRYAKFIGKEEEWKEITPVIP